MTDKPMALIVEDDEFQRTCLAILLEDEMDVFQCESGEAAELVLQEVGPALCFLFTDVQLAGSMTGAELASIVTSRYPQMHVVVTSGRKPPPLPSGAKFMEKPWNSLDVLREASEARPH